MFNILLEDNSPSLLQQIDGVDGRDKLENGDEENMDLHGVLSVGVGTRIGAPGSRMCKNTISMRS